jgi:hypothetical protein
MRKSFVPASGTVKRVVWVGADPANTSYIRVWRASLLHSAVGIYTTLATNVNKKQLAPYSSFTTEIAADQTALYVIDDATMLGQGAVC